MEISTQHRALYIGEVYRNICRVANDSTLAVLARTCKYFHEPAVQMLWRDLPDLVPLVKLFPENVWIIENQKIVSCRTKSPPPVLIGLCAEILSAAVSARLGNCPQTF